MGDSGMDDVICYAIIKASQAGDFEFIKNNIYPTICSREGALAPSPGLKTKFVNEAPKWAGSPLLAPIMNDIIRKVLGPGAVADPSLFPNLTPNAKEMAQILDDFENTKEWAPILAGRPGGVAKDITDDLKSLTPGRAIKMLKRSSDPASLRESLQGESFLRALGSKAGSTRSMASALRQWHGFCEAIGADSFPVVASRFAQFGCIFRCKSTFKQYLAHVRSAAEIWGYDCAWANDPILKRIASGIEKGKFWQKKEPLSVPGDVLVRLLGAEEDWDHRHIFLAISFAFMLRADSEAPLLRRGTTSVLCDASKPLQDGVKGVLAENGAYTGIRLSTRKNSLSGAVIARECSCDPSADDLSSYIPRQICVKHIIGPWVYAQCRPGERIFPDGIAGQSVKLLNDGLARLGVRGAGRYGLHSLRRGSAQALVDRGGDLGALLIAGGWRSTAFRHYLDAIGVERATFRATFSRLIDVDEVLDENLEGS